MAATFTIQELLDLDVADVSNLNLCDQADTIIKLATQAIIKLTMEDAVCPETLEIAGVSCGNDKAIDRLTKLVKCFQAIKKCELESSDFGVRETINKCRRYC